MPKARTVFFTIRNKQEAGPHCGYTTFACNADSMLDALKQCQTFISKNKPNLENRIAAIELYEQMPAKDVASAMFKYDPSDDGDDAEYGTQLADAIIHLQRNGRKLYAIVGEVMDISRLVHDNTPQESDFILNFDPWDLAIANPYV